MCSQKSEDCVLNFLNIATIPQESKYFNINFTVIDSEINTNVSPFGVRNWLVKNPIPDQINFFLVSDTSPPIPKSINFEYCLRCSIFNSLSPLLLIQIESYCDLVRCCI